MLKNDGILHPARRWIPVFFLIGGLSFGCAKPQPRPSPGATPRIDVPPSVLSYGYEIWTFKRPTELRLNLYASVNLVTGRLIAVGEGAPDPAVVVNPKEFDRIARDLAFKQARQALRDALLGQAIIPRFGGAFHAAPLREAMEHDPGLRQQVEKLLGQGPAVRSSKEEWTWKVTLVLDLKRHPWLYDRLVVFQERALAHPYYRAIPPRKIVDGAPFPPFALSDVRSGKAYSLENLPGRAVLFMFWMTDDFGSIWTLSEMERFYRQYRARGLDAVGIVAAGSRAAAREILKERGIGFPNLYDERSELSKKVGAGIHPYYVLVSRPDNLVLFQSYGTLAGNIDPKAPLFKHIMQALKG